VQSNVVVVTEPDVFHADQPSIFLIGCDDYVETIVDNLRRLPIPVTVYCTSAENSLLWINNAYIQSEISILNCKFSAFLSGFFIDKQNVWYYNNIESYKRFNLNSIHNPMDALIKWMTKWDIDNQEKNAVYM